VRGNEVILHVDYDQRGALGIEPVKRMFSAYSRANAFNYIGKKFYFVHWPLTTWPTASLKP
jgi:hypothetical protein